MEILLLIVLVLASPALLAGSILFPCYWIGQYRLLRQTGSWVLQREFHDRWMVRFGKAILTSYVLCLGGLFLPGVFPKVSSFLWSGRMLWILGLVAIDMAVLVSLSPDRAVELWKAGGDRSRA